MRGAKAATAFLLLSVSGCAGASTSPASPPPDPVAQILVSHHIDLAFVARRTGAGHMPSNAILATARSTVGAVRASTLADYPHSKIPSVVESLPAGVTVTLCALDGTKLSTASPQVRVAVLAVAQDGNTWWAGGHLS